MKIHITLVILTLSLLSQLCKGQACQSVQRVDAKDGVGYIGIVDLPGSVDVMSNHLFMLMLAKSVSKTDTTYQLNVGMNANGVSGKTSPKGVLLQFEDGSKISKPDQSLEVVPMTDGLAVLSAEVILTVDDVRRLKAKSLIAITLASHDVKVARDLLNKVASCLLITW